MFERKPSGSVRAARLAGAWVLALGTAVCHPVASSQGLAQHAPAPMDWSQPLSKETGDAARGASIVASRQHGLCVLCHQAPVGDRQFQGNIAPDLAGAGSRWNAAQLRERIADGSVINPESIMPRYFRTDGLYRVSTQAVGKPLLSGQEIEDVLAFLLTLKN